MPQRSRIQKNSYKNRQITRLITNLLLFSLTLIIFGFIYSSIERIIINKNIETNKIDLSLEIKQSEYESKTGYKIQIEIWNGCGIPKLAQIYSNYLRSEGIDVLDTKNAKNYNYTETKILQHRGEKEIAITVADIMNIDYDNIEESLNKNLFYDLTLILGNNYITLPSYKKALMHKKPF